MDVPVNYLGVFLAAVSSMVVGGIWYSEKVMGKQWMKLAGLKKKDMEQGAGKALTVAFVMALVTAYVFWHMAYISSEFYTDKSFLYTAISTGFWLWLGFQATQMIMNGTFEQRPKKLVKINVINQLVTLLVMGLVIGLVGV